MTLNELNFEQAAVLPEEPKPPDLRSHPPCECHPNGQGNFQCVGCGICYHNYPEVSVINEHCREIGVDDEIIDFRIGNIRWLCPSCDLKFMKNDEKCFIGYLKSTSQKHQPSNSVSSSEESSEPLTEDKLVIRSLLKSFENLTQFVENKFNDISTRFDLLPFTNDGGHDLHSPLRKRRLLTSSSVPSYASHAKELSNYNLLGNGHAASTLLFVMQLHLNHL